MNIKDYKLKRPTEETMNSTWNILFEKEKIGSLAFNTVHNEWYGTIIRKNGDICGLNDRSKGVLFAWLRSEHKRSWEVAE